jgi:hypothetical protein
MVFSMHVIVPHSVEIFVVDEPKNVWVIESFSLCHKVHVFGPQLSTRITTDIILMVAILPYCPFIVFNSINYLFVHLDMSTII